MNGWQDGILAASQVWKKISGHEYVDVFLSSQLPPEFELGGNCFGYSGPELAAGLETLLGRRVADSSCVLCDSVAGELSAANVCGLTLHELCHTATQGIDRSAKAGVNFLRYARYVHSLALGHPPGSAERLANGSDVLPRLGRNTRSPRKDDPRSHFWRDGHDSQWCRAAVHAAYSCRHSAVELSWLRFRSQSHLQHYANSLRSELNSKSPLRFTLASPPSQEFIRLFESDRQRVLSRTG